MADRERLRAFVALRLDAAVEAAVSAFIDQLRATDYGIRWVRRSQLHVTLRFLGAAVPRAQVARLDAALRDRLPAIPAFTLAVRGTGAFPNPRRPRILWIGLRSASLLALATLVERAALDCGFTPADHPFAPHLTIGRLRAPQPPPGLAELIAGSADREFGACLVDSLVLYQSILGADSPTSRELARHPLSGRP